MSRLQRALDKRFPRVGDAVRAASDLGHDSIESVSDSLENVVYDARRSARLSSARATQAVAPRRFRRQELIVAADTATTRSAIEAAIMRGNDGSVFMGVASPSTWNAATPQQPLEWRLIQGYAVARTFEAWITLSPVSFTRTGHGPGAKAKSEVVNASLLTVIASGKSLRPTETEREFFDGTWGGKVQASAEGRAFDRRDISFDRGIF